MPPRCCCRRGCATPRWRSMPSAAMPTTPSTAHRPAQRPAGSTLLRARLDRAYAGRPRNDPVERAFATMVAEHALPRALPEALLDGFAWDDAGRRYETLSDLRAYAARVAASVGAMMSVLMGVARPRRAGPRLRPRRRDAAHQRRPRRRRGRGRRPALPAARLAARGRHRARRLPRRPAPGPAAGRGAAPPARRGRPPLPARRGRRRGAPAGCRPGILAASRIYAGIGRRVAAAGHDSVSRRARTSTGEKLALVAYAAVSAAALRVPPRSAFLHAPPLPETAFLVDAVAERPAAAWGSGRAGTVVSIFAQLEARTARDGLGAGLRPLTCLASTRPVSPSAAAAAPSAPASASATATRSGRDRAPRARRRQSRRPPWSAIAERQ